MPRIDDFPHRYRGTLDQETEGLYWNRVFEDEKQTSFITMSGLPQNQSKLVTNIAVHMVPELIQRHFPHRFEELPPAIFLEHYVEERTSARPRLDLALSLVEC